MNIIDEIWGGERGRRITVYNIAIIYICNIIIRNWFAPHTHTRTHEVMWLNLKPYIIQTRIMVQPLNYPLHIILLISTYNGRVYVIQYNCFTAADSSVDYFAACLLFVRPRHRLSSARVTDGRAYVATTRSPTASIVQSSRDRRY